MNKEFLENLKTNLRTVSNLAYEGDANNSIANMVEIIAQLDELLCAIDEETRQDVYENALVPLLDAMENKSCIDIGDIIVYELLPLIDDLS